MSDFSQERKQKICMWSEEQRCPVDLLILCDLLIILMILEDLVQGCYSDRLLKNNLLSRVVGQYHTAPLVSMGYLFHPTENKYRENMYTIQNGRCLKPYSDFQCCAYILINN